MFDNDRLTGVAKIHSRVVGVVVGKIEIADEIRKHIRTNAIQCALIQRTTVALRTQQKRFRFIKLDSSTRQPTTANNKIHQGKSRKRKTEDIRRTCAANAPAST